MWYIFNADRKPVAMMETEPNHDDLTSRGEVAVEHSEEMPLLDAELTADGRVQRKPASVGPIPEEAAWAVLRAERNRRLARSDWTVLPDSPLSPEKVAEWKVYRQALRDLPENTTDPANPVWPAPPA